VVTVRLEILATLAAAYGEKHYLVPMTNQPFFFHRENRSLSRQDIELII
jgi:hypothetical protein